MAKRRQANVPGDGRGRRRSSVEPHRHRWSARLDAVTYEREWAEPVAFLLSRDKVPAAQAMGRLLAQAEGAWHGRVVPRTSMHDLLFTIPGDPYPFSTEVRVSWSEGLVDLRLISARERVRVLVTADRCREATAPAVLDSFLLQLVGGETPAKSN